MSEYRNYKDFRTEYLKAGLEDIYSAFPSKIQIMPICDFLKEINKEISKNESLGYNMVKFRDKLDLLVFGDIIDFPCNTSIEEIVSKYL